MSRIKRQSSSPDIGRLSAGLQRPGMDTRIWVSLAFAVDDSAVQDEGVFVDVVLLPTGETMTARVPAEYAGESFGLYSQILKDDEVVVEIPRGDPNEGAVVTRRLWNKQDKPPQVAKDNPKDFILVVKKDVNLRLVTSGTGQVLIKGEDKVIVDTTGNVEIKGGNVIFKDGSTPVAKEGSSTTGHQHSLSGSAGPYAISGTAVTTTDTIATGAGSQNVKVP